MSPESQRVAEALSGFAVEALQHGRVLAGADRHRAGGLRAKPHTEIARYATRLTP